MPKPFKPRIVIHANGNATLSGVPYRYLSHLLTAAALHEYDEQKKNEAHLVEEQARADANDYGLGDVIRRNIAREKSWFKTVHWLRDELDRVVKAAVLRTHGTDYQPKLTLKERLRANEKDRRFWRSFMAEHFQRKPLDKSTGSV